MRKQLTLVFIFLMAFNFHASSQGEIKSPSESISTKKKNNSQRPVEAPTLDRDIDEDTSKELQKLARQFERTFSQSCEGFKKRKEMYAQSYFTFMDKMREHAMHSNWEKLRKLSSGEIELVVKLRKKLTLNELKTLTFEEVVKKLNCYEVPYSLPYRGQLKDMVKFSENKITGYYESLKMKDSFMFFFEDGKWKINPFGGTPYGLVIDMKKRKGQTREAYIKKFLKKKGWEESLLQPLQKK